MVEPAIAVAPAGAAAHHKNAHRWFRLDPGLDAPGLDAPGRDTAQPMVEPAQAQIEEIRGEIAVDRRRVAEIDLAGMAQRAVAVCPRSEDQTLRTAPGALEA